MKIVRLICASLILFCISTAAQTPAKPAFEVASIKPLPPLETLMADIQSGKLRLNMLGMRVDGARVDMGLITLRSMLSMAYKLKPYQIVGPSWLGTQMFEIHATLPEGATKEQIPDMLQSLLAERFKLTAHVDNKEQPVYGLVVSKSGPKLKEAVDEQAPTPATDPPKTSPPKEPAGKEIASIDTPGGQIKMRQEGRSLVVSSGGANRRTTSRIDDNGSMIMEISKLNMNEFAELLTQYLDRPVLNKTDLTGSYQVELEIPRGELLNLVRKNMPDLPIGPGGSGELAAAAPATGLAGTASDPSGGAIFQAVQKLGLKLESQKAPMDSLIIEHIEKDPTEN